MKMNSAKNIPEKQFLAILPVSVDFSSHGATASLDFALEGIKFRDRLISEARNFMCRYPSVAVSASEGVAYEDRCARVGIAVQGSNSPTNGKEKELFRRWLAGRLPKVELRDAADSLSSSDLCAGELAQNEGSNASEGNIGDEIGEPPPSPKDQKERVLDAPPSGTPDPGLIELAPALTDGVRGEATTSLDKGSLKQPLGGAFALEGKRGTACGGRPAAGTRSLGSGTVGGPQKDSDEGPDLVSIPPPSSESGEKFGLTQAPGYAAGPTSPDRPFCGSAEWTFDPAPDPVVPEPNVPEPFSEFELELEAPPRQKREKHFVESIDEEAVHLIVNNQPVVLLCPGAHALTSEQLRVVLAQSKFEANAYVLARLWSGPGEEGQDS